MYCVCANCHLPVMCSHCLDRRPPPIALPPPSSSTLPFSDHREANYLDDKPTVRVYCQSKTDHSLTIHDGKVIIAPCKPSDPRQHWVKDEKFGVNIKDEQGYSSFSLINKATGQALKHAIGINYPIQLTEYKVNACDESLLWSLSKNQGGGYRAIRPVSNIHLNLDAYDGGPGIIFFDWHNHCNQKWSISFY